MHLSAGKRKLSFIFFILLGSCICKGVNGQTCTDFCDKIDSTFPVPYMHVAKDSGELREQEFHKWRFKRSKYGHMKRVNDMNAVNNFAFVINYEVMKEFLCTTLKSDSITMHFARKPKAGNHFDLALLFSAQKKPSAYYEITNEGINIVETENAIVWIEDFNKKNQQNLIKTINDHDEYNYYIGSDNVRKLSDTRSMSYSREDMIRAFICEHQYQSTINKITIAAFGVKLAAYDKNGTIDRNENIINKKRLFAQFYYLEKSSGQLLPFYLDKQESYKDRIKPVWSEKPINNGQLCPNNCN